ncbi:conserved hypothetical protein [Theileria orientalis strain Shintoku]|uniref:Uncharacterized protein n=1 Tax=Theileria orientalis strain Shintoku TaxID=869250 RepID=J4D8A6_THEOR|nr:conserved hypothetical protein [Theileria orientalis strain Shintoku]BAM40670.1 conserved hypothetical protein [Theileria orientalis strain Shintoku]|eukprot:XP_009690971.1 conserved hypothetical protein [Theileria orientalis strain Shintoku]
MAKIAPTHIFIILLSLGLLPASNCYHLDITQKESYVTSGKNVTVNRLNLSENVYNHNFPEPLLLSDIVQKGESVLFDKLFFRDQPVKYATVFWENEDPAIVHVYTGASTVVLLNNGNGRFFEQSILSDAFATNVNEDPHPTTEKQVALELNNARSYSATGVGVSVTEVPKFDSRLAPYTVHYQNVDDFRVSGLKFNDRALDVPLSNAVHGVYVYSKDGVPLLVELVNSTSRHDYYVANSGGAWEKTLFPSIFDPLYNHHFVKKLNSLTTGCTSSFVLDFTNRRVGLHTVQISCATRAGTTSLSKTLKIEKSTITADIWHREGLSKLTYRLEPAAPFEPSALSLDGRTLNIRLPPGPYNSITVYFQKCPLVIHFSGPHTNSFYEFVKHQPYAQFTDNTANERQLLSKVAKVRDRYHVMSILFRWY